MKQPPVLQHCSWGEAKCCSDVPKTAPGTFSLQGQPARHFKLQLYQQALKIKCSAEPGTKPLHLHNSNTYWSLSIKNYVIFCLISPARRTSLALTFLSTKAGSLKFCFFPPSQDAVIQLQENHSDSPAWDVSSSPFPKLYSNTVMCFPPSHKQLSHTHCISPITGHHLATPEPFSLCCCPEEAILHPAPLTEATYSH